MPSQMSLVDGVDLTVDAFTMIVTTNGVKEESILVGRVATALFPPQIIYHIPQFTVPNRQRAAQSQPTTRTQPPLRPSAPVSGADEPSVLVRRRSRIPSARSEHPVRPVPPPQFIATHPRFPSPTYSDASRLIQSPHYASSASVHLCPPASTCDIVHPLIKQPVPSSLQDCRGDYERSMGSYTIVPLEWPDFSQVSAEFDAVYEGYLLTMIMCSDPFIPPLSPPLDDSGPDVSSVEHNSDDAYGEKSPLFSPAPSPKNEPELELSEESNIEEASPELSPDASTAPAEDWATPPEPRTAFESVQTASNVLSTVYPLPPRADKYTFSQSHLMPVSRRLFSFGLGAQYSTSQSTSGSSSPDIMASYQHHHPHRLVHRDATPVSGLVSPNPGYSSILHSCAASVAGPSNANELPGRLAEIQQSLRFETQDEQKAPQKCPSIGVLTQSEIRAKIEEATTARDSETPPFGCEWNGCGQTVRLKDLRSHLRDVHSLPMSGESVDVQCAWGGCTSELMRNDSLVKHIHSGTHLAISVRCPTCRCELARPDALRRHLLGDRR
ncbi:hypothetical protein C8R44DRAFT_742429 [Mycena epipterygia]|nr:hypothetical protein C8R44DRAFT_742429 [Mycena epipterygia]